MGGTLRTALLAGVALVVPLSTQTGATIYQCRDQSGSIIYTDSLAQLQQCLSVPTSEAAASSPKASPPPFDPNVPLVQVPTEPGYPPKFVPATNIDPETNPFTTTKSFTQVRPPKMSPAQVGTPEALPPRTFPRPPSEGEDSSSTAASKPQAQTEEHQQQQNPIRFLRPFFPNFSIAPPGPGYEPTP